MLIKRGLAATIAGLCIGAVFAGGAAAAPSSVSITRGHSCPADEPGCAIETAAVTASAAGDTLPHTITLDSDPVGIVVTDTAGATAGAECTQLGPERVRCPKQVTISCCPAGPFTIPDADITGSEAADSITLLDPHVLPFVHGAGGGDTIVGSPNHESIRGDAGPDQIIGNGNDFLEGGQGRDLLQGGPGLDTLIGDGGPDRLLGDLDADSLEGGRGRDMLVGGPGSDTLFGGGGIDFLVARDGEHDHALNCGNPTGRHERITRDRVDPHPADC
jgi:hypothetical protein